MHDMSDYHTLSARQITTAIGQLRIPAKLNSHSGQREHPDP